MKNIVIKMIIIKIVTTGKDCDWKIHACKKINFSGNEVIRAVLNSFFFFLRKDFTCTKALKAQRRNRAKAQKAASEQKQKMRLKTSKEKKVIYLLICVVVLFVRVKERNRKKRKVPTMLMY